MASYGSDTYLTTEGGRIEGKAVAELWSEQEDLYRESYDRILAARRMLAGEITAPLPDKIQVTDRDAFRVSLPQKYTVPIHLLNKLSEATPQVRRFPAGASPRAQAMATLVEQNANAYMHHLYPLAATIDLLLNEGECAVICSPTMASWEKTPQLYEDGTRRVKRRYQRDRDGKSRDDGEPGARFVPNLRESTKAFKSEELHYLAQHIPFEFRAISRLNSMPINPRIVGRRVEIDGLLVKTNFTVSELLRRKYRWGENGALQPGRRSEAKLSDDIALYEVWTTDLDDHVYVSYCVDGQETWKQGPEGERQPAVVDLTKLYGLTRVPVAYAYGWHWPGVVDPDKRGIPFVDPFARSWLNMDTIATSEVWRMWTHSFISLLYRPDVDLIDRVGAQLDELPSIDLHPMTVTPILGSIQMPVAPQGSAEAARLMSLLGGSLSSETPAPISFGGSGATSGFDRNVAEADMLGTMTQVTRGMLSLFEQSASLALEIATAIGKRHRAVVVEHVDGTIVEQTASKQSSTRALLELDPDLCGDDYVVKAEIPHQFGDNLAIHQLAAEWRDRGILPTRKLLELAGDPAPEQTMAETDAERLSKMPQFEARVIARALAILGDQEMSDEIMAALAEGPDGQPVPQGFDAGLEQGQGNGPPMEAHGGGMTGMGQPNLPAASLGGQISGQTQTASVMRSQAAGVSGGLPQ